MKTISHHIDNGIADRLLDPFAACLTPAMARRIVKFRADSATQARVDALATKCNEGELTVAERREYEAYVRGIHFISIFQSKARAFLAKSRQSR